jgi:glycosyltransferase involved in cell wall biosynthesis
MARELHHGGCERQLTEIALALDPERFEVHVGAFRVEGMRAGELRSAGVPVVRVPVKSFWRPGAVVALCKLGRYIRANRIRLVHAFDVPLTIAAMPVVRFLSPAIALASQRSHLDLISKRKRRLVLFSERIAHGVVVNCEYIRRHLMEDGNIPAEKIHLCRNGIDLNRFRREPGAARPAALPPGALVIGAVCVLRPEKGLTTLVDAFALVRGAAPDLRLLIVGSGPMLPELRRRAAERGVLDACVFEPSTDQVPQWLRSIDIFVLPSLTEALSNSLMEAMACGCCCAASRVGGNPELIEDGVRGLLFEAGDPADLARALREVILKPDLRRRLAEAGHDFLHANFSIAAAARRMEEIYTGLLAGRPFEFQ